MDKRQKKALIILLTPLCIGLVIGFILGFCVGRSGSHSDIPESDDIASEAVMPEPVFSTPAEELSDEKPQPERKEIIYYRKRLKYASLFRDLNEEHLAMGKKVGLDEPLKTRAEIPGTPGLVPIKENNLYVFHNLRFSSPYLTRGAAQELHDIAQAFRDSLRNKNLLEYKLVVTSVLRTEEDVAKLRRSGNANASANSSHCYGSTFDIAYTRYYKEDESEAFMQPFELTKVLGEVLLDRKKAGKCLVKYEKVEHCFHITATH